MTLFTNDSWSIFNSVQSLHIKFFLTTCIIALWVKLNFSLFSRHLLFLVHFILYTVTHSFISTWALFIDSFKEFYFRLKIFCGTDFSSKDEKTFRTITTSCKITYIVIHNDTICQKKLKILKKNWADIKIYRSFKWEKNEFPSKMRNPSK